MKSRLTERQYDLLLTGPQKFAVVIPLVFLVIMPPIIIFVFRAAATVDMERAMPPFFPLSPFIFFLGFTVFYGWRLATLPYRITATAGETLEFKSFLNVRAVRVSELLSIEPRTLRIQAGISGYVLRHRDGEILFPGQFTGLHVLLTELSNANPGLEIRGC